MKKKVTAPNLEAERLQIELKRLAIEETRARTESSFWHRHTRAIVASLMSAAIAVGGLIYVSKGQLAT